MAETLTDESDEDDATQPAPWETAVARLEQQYPESHVQYICAVYAEYLEDADEPE